MTNGFSVQADDLAGTASVLASAGERLGALMAPARPEAGRSSDEVAAAVGRVVEEASSLGDELSGLAAAFEAAARSYADADDAVAASLLVWGR